MSRRPAAISATAFCNVLTASPAAVCAFFWFWSASRVFSPFVAEFFFFFAGGSPASPSGLDCVWRSATSAAAVDRSFLQCLH